MALGCENRGDKKGAVRAYHKAIEVDPKNAEAHNFLAVLLEKIGNQVGANAEYSEAYMIELEIKLAHDPNNAEAYLHLALECEDRGDMERAQRAYHKAIEVDPKNAKAHNFLAILLEEIGNQVGANAEYYEADMIKLEIKLAHDPNNAEANFDLALECEDRGDMERAVRAYHKAIEVDPKNAKAHYYLADLAALAPEA